MNVGTLYAAILINCYRMLGSCWQTSITLQMGGRLYMFLMMNL